MADPRERFNDTEEALRAVAERESNTKWTALPVKVVEDSDGHIVKLQPTIKGAIQSSDGSISNTNMPEMGMVPIHFPAGGGFTITHPVKKDDEGIAIFSSRCIDGWWKDGGIQPEPYHRQNNLSDAMYIPGIRNKPRKLNPYASKDTLQIRSDDQHFYIEISKDTVKVVYSEDKQKSAFEFEEPGPEQTTDTQDDKDKEKKTTPIMVVEITKDHIKSYVLDSGGKEQSYSEHTKQGELKAKFPKNTTYDTPQFHITGDLLVDGKIIAGGEITAKAPRAFNAEGVWSHDESPEAQASGNNIALSQHVHAQPPDSRGDQEKDTSVPKMPDT